MAVSVELKRSFMRLLELKRTKAEADKDIKALKADFQQALFEETKENLGKLVILEDLGSGVVFKEQKSSISKTKLLELGVSEEIIEQATGCYIAMDVFTK